MDHPFMLLHEWKLLLTPDDERDNTFGEYSTCATTRYRTKQCQVLRSSNPCSTEPPSFPQSFSPSFRSATASFPPFRFYDPPVSPTIFRHPVRVTHPSTTTLPPPPALSSSPLLSTAAPLSPPLLPVAEVVLPGHGRRCGGLRFTLPRREVIGSSELRIQESVSEGTFGSVYRALWGRKEVAVKKCKVPYGRDMTVEQLRNVEREINVLRCLRHEHIVRYYGSCIEPSFLAVVTEYLPGGNVFDLLYTKRYCVTAEMRHKMAVQLLSAVCYLHSRRVVHRDLKTANFVIDHNLNLKLCDFGKTKISVNGVVQLDDNGGSPRYMAPECFRKGSTICDRSDVWSLGCCLIELFGGPIPFERMADNQRVISAILVGKQSPTVPGWFHPEIKRCIHQCLCWQPCMRPSARDVAALLQSVPPHELARFGMDTKRV